MPGSLDSWAGTEVSRGFTLLELLISMAIFSMLSLGAYQLLQSVTRSHEQVEDIMTANTRLNLALSIMQRDFNQFVPRPVRDAYGEPLEPMAFDPDEYVIEFTRLGWRNPAGRQRSNLQRVAYSIDYDTEELHRHFWEVLDRAEDSEPVSQLLLTGVSDLVVTGYTQEDSAMGEEMSLEPEGSVMPRAVEVSITLSAGGEVTRLFELVDSAIKSSDDRVDGEGEGEGEGEAEEDLPEEDIQPDEDVPDEPQEALQE